VQAYDWAGFLNQRLHSTDAHAPLGGIDRSGWKLVYDGVRSDYWKAVEDMRKWTDLSYSIGLKVGEDGSIVDVMYEGAAQKAGVAPSTKLIAVNNRQFTLRCYVRRWRRLPPIPNRSSCSLRLGTTTRSTGSTITVASAILTCRATRRRPTCCPR